MQYFSIISQTSYLLYWRLFTQDMSTNFKITNNHNAIFFNHFPNVIFVILTIIYTRYVHIWITISCEINIVMSIFLVVLDQLITLSSRGAAFNGIQTPSKPPLVDIIQCHLHKSFWISNKDCGLWLVVNSGCCYLSTPPPLMSVVTGCRLASWAEINSTNKTLLPDFSLLPYIWSILNTDIYSFQHLELSVKHRILTVSRKRFHIIVDHFNGASKSFASPSLTIVNSLVIDPRGHRVVNICHIIRLNYTLINIIW